MKQTAVEWLVRELNQELNYIPIAQWDRIRDIVQRAKAMEKEQIIDAYLFGEENQYASQNIESSVNISPSEYYRKTYGEESDRS